MEGKETHHVSEIKKELVKELAERMKRKTVMVVSVNGLPSAQYQDIKKKLRDKVVMQVAKKSLIDFALDHCGIKELHKLVPYVKDSTALLFSDYDAFEISGILANNKSPTKAKNGDIAPFDIEIKAGPTDLLPGPDISALSSVGLAPKVEGGKIVIMKDKVIVQAGKIIHENAASIMTKLGVVPFEVGIDPIAAYMDGVVYADIKIDTDAMITELEIAYGKTIPFSVEIGYVTNDTLDFILARAGIHGNAIEALVDENKSNGNSSAEKIDKTESTEVKETDVKEEETNVEEKEEQAEEAASS